MESLYTPTELEAINRHREFRRKIAKRAAELEAKKAAARKAIEAAEQTAPDQIVFKNADQFFSAMDAIINANFEPTVTDIKAAACRYFNLTRIDLESSRRTADIVYPRQIVFYLCRTLTSCSLPQIGMRLGGKDHTTVLHAYQKIERLRKTDWTVAYDIAHVEAML